MNIFKTILSWLKPPVNQPWNNTPPMLTAEEPELPITAPAESVTEFYLKDEGYSKEVYSSTEDAPATVTPVPEVKKTRKAKPVGKKPAVKTPAPKKPQPSRKVPAKKAAPKKK